MSTLTCIYKDIDFKNSDLPDTLEELEKQIAVDHESVSNVSSVTSRSQEIRLLKIPEPQFFPAPNERSLDTHSILASLKNNLSFSKFTLHFYNPVYEDRFQSYLLRQCSPISIFFVITVPGFANAGVFGNRLYDDFKASTVGSAYIYCLWLFLLIACFLLLYYNYKIRNWSILHGQTSVEADFPVKDEEEGNEYNIPVHIRTPYFVTAYRTALIGNCANLLATLVIGLYLIWRTYTGYCYGGCIGNFPLFTAGSLFYVPVHLTLVTCCKYWVTIVMGCISVTTLIISLILFPSFNVNSIYLGFAPIMQLFFFTLVFFGTQYVVQNIRIVSFCQRELLTQIVYDDERKSLYDIIRLWM